MTEFDSYGDRHEFEPVGGASAGNEPAPEMWRRAFNERHEFDVYPDHFMTGMRNEFCAGWHAALKAAPASRDSIGGDAAQLARIRAHINDYHFALDSRLHGGLAQSKAFESICKELGTYWTQGEEAKRRATQTKTEPQ